MSATIRKTREQDRAKDAWDVVERVPHDARDEYGRWARKLPAMIQTNGLGAALAFLRAKGGGDPKKAQRLLYGDVSKWVTSSLGASQSDLLRWILESGSSTYRQATTEALAYAIWLRRFVEGMGWGAKEEGG